MAGRWLERLGLGRPELRAWAAYDWGNSAFYTTVISAVFPIYFSRVLAAELPPAAATARFGLTSSVALAFAAVLCPLAGALADRRGRIVPLLVPLTAVGVLATLGLALVGKGDWLAGAALFGLGNVAIQTCLVLYDALLPRIARPDEIDRVSTAGYALGYVGGGLLLALNLLWIQQPGWFGLPDAGAGTRLSFVSVAVWWLLFALPLLRRPDLGRVPVGEGRSAGTLALVRGVVETLRSLRHLPQARTMLLAFLVYGEGIGTVIRMAAIYGAEVGIETGALIGALLLTQFVGIPFSFLFGALGDRLGTRRAIFLGLAVYVGISVLGAFLRTSAHFFALAFLVGAVQGGTQALSRSLFASLIPVHRSGELFGFFSIATKLAGAVGPALFGLTTALTGSSRGASLFVSLLFLGGGALLARVDVAEGRRAVATAAPPERVGPTAPA